MKETLNNASENEPFFFVKTNIDVFPKCTFREIQEFAILIVDIIYHNFNRN